MGVASGCGEQEVGVASGSGWNLWVWLLGVVLRRYIDFLILLIPTPLVSVLFGSSIPTSVFILLKLFCVLHIILNENEGNSSRQNETIHHTLAGLFNLKFLYDFMSSLFCTQLVLV